MNDCWQAWFDGAALPNPGKLGLGVVLLSPAGRRFEFSQRGEGVGCSNEAELQALQMALSRALTEGARSIVLSGDSDFAVCHVSGRVRTAVEHLQRLVGEVQTLAAGFEHLELRWVPRHRNGDADRLSRAALGLVHKPAPHPGKLPRGKKRWRSG